VPKIEIDLPGDHVSVKIRGNIVAKIADAFKAKYMSDIRAQIIPTVADAIKA